MHLITMSCSTTYICQQLYYPHSTDEMKRKHNERVANLMATVGNRDLALINKLDINRHLHLLSGVCACACVVYISHSCFFACCIVYVVGVYILVSVCVFSHYKNSTDFNVNVVHPISPGIFNKPRLTRNLRQKFSCFFWVCVCCIERV